jgi:hypothetical protein
VDVVMGKLYRVIPHRGDILQVYVYVFDNVNAVGIEVKKNGKVHSAYKESRDSIDERYEEYGLTDDISQDFIRGAFLC